MTPEDLMRKYKYGYVHSSEILDEPFVKDLIKENQELKKQLSIITLQLEEIKLSKRDYSQENILEMKLTLKETQQKEFIEWLEYQVKLQEELNDNHLATGFEEILSRYKEIIGDDK